MFPLNDEQWRFPLNDEQWRFPLNDEQWRRLKATTAFR
jgi:hypothetical protein